MNTMNEKIPIRLCISSSMRTENPLLMESFELSQAKEFGEEIEKVILVHYARNFSHRELMNNVHVYTIPSFEHKSWFWFAFSIITDYFLTLPILIWLIKKYGINLIRIDDLLITGFPSVLASRICRKPSIVYLRGNSLKSIKYQMKDSKKIFTTSTVRFCKWLSKFVITKVDASIAVNTELFDFAKASGSKKNYLSYVHFEPHRFIVRENRNNLDNFTVLNVGRLEKEKGSFVMLEVASILRNVNFKIVGDGSQKKELMKIIEDKELTNVSLLGGIPYEEMYKVYNTSDIFVLPSFSEGLPITMLEAMASELPVIVSDVGDVSKILKGENGGFAVPTGNVEAIVSKIKLLINDEKLRSNLGRRGRINSISNFGNFIKDQITIYQDIAKTGSK